MALMDSPLTTTSFPLPPELLAIILGFVGQSEELRRTMKDCALVSRAWCTLSQPHIFEYIQIELSKTDTEEWLERLRGSPHLPPMIRHITLTSRAFDQEIWETSAAEALGRELTHVQSLTLRGHTDATEIRDLDPHISLFSNLGSKNGGLQALQFNYVDFQRSDDLFRYLSHVSGKVSNLILKLGDGMDLRNLQSHHEPVEGTEPWPLRCLTLYHTSFRTDVLSWILGASVRLTELRFLVLAIDLGETPCIDLDPPTGSLLEQLVSKVGSNLTSLTLGIYEDERISFTDSMFQQLVALKQLIILSQWESGLVPRVGLTYVITLLPALRTLQHLSEIVLAVDIDVYSGKDIVEVSSLDEWSLLDKELTASTMPAFQKLFVIVEATSVIDPNDPLNEVYLIDLERAVRSGMSRSEAKGLLDVCAEEVIERHPKL